MRMLFVACRLKDRVVVLAQCFRTASSPPFANHPHQKLFLEARRVCACACVSGRFAILLHQHWCFLKKNLLGLDTVSKRTQNRSRTLSCWKETS